MSPTSLSVTVNNKHNYYPSYFGWYCINTFTTLSSVTFNNQHNSPSYYQLDQEQEYIFSSNLSMFFVSSLLDPSFAVSLTSTISLSSISLLLLFHLNIFFVKDSTAVQHSAYSLGYTPYISTEIQELGCDSDQIWQKFCQKVRQIQQKIRNLSCGPRIKYWQSSSIPVSLSDSLTSLWIWQEFFINLTNLSIFLSSDLLLSDGNLSISTTLTMSTVNLNLLHVTEHWWS